MAAKRVFATGLVELYVSVMTWASRSDDRCFRMEDIERRTRKVKRASNWATARSSNAKLAMMSVGDESVAAETSPEIKGKECDSCATQTNLRWLSLLYPPLLPG